MYNRRKFEYLSLNMLDIFATLTERIILDLMTKICELSLRITPTPKY